LPAFQKDKSISDFFPVLPKICKHYYKKIDS